MDFNQDTSDDVTIDSIADMFIPDASYTRSCTNEDNKVYAEIMPLIGTSIKISAAYGRRDTDISFTWNRKYIDPVKAVLESRGYSVIVREPRPDDNILTDVQLKIKW